MTRTTTLSSSWRTLLAGLAEPTLVRRSVVSVTIAFVLVWAVLLTYNYINYIPHLSAKCDFEKRLE